MSTILSTQERETIIENLSNDPFYILPEYVTPNNLKLTKKEKEKISNSLKKRAKEKRQESRDSVNNRFHFYDVIKKIENINIGEKVNEYVEAHYKLETDDDLSREERLNRLSEYFNVTSEKKRVLTNSLKESFYNILEYCLNEIEPILKTQTVYKNTAFEISKNNYGLFLEVVDKMDEIFFFSFKDNIITFDFWNECVNEAIDNYFNYPHTSKPHHEDEPAPEVLQNLKNNFDDRPIEDVYDYFKTNLVDKKRLSEDDLMKYLKQAFDEQEPPKKKLKMKYNTKQEITRVFYNYYKIEKLYGQQQKYVDLLRLYFESFENTTTNNFNK